jgi:hypothetical protein
VLASYDRTAARGTSWPDEVLGVLEEGLKRAGKVAKRSTRPTDPRPYRGRGVAPDGSVRLAVSLRVLRRGFEPLGGVTVDSAALPAGQWAKLAPVKVEAGHSWEVPASAAKSLSRILSPQSDLTTLATPGEVTAVRLAGKVERVRDGIAYLRYEGRIASVHKYPYPVGERKTWKNSARVALVGVGSYDVKARKMLSLMMVGDGVYRHWAPYDAPQAYAAVLEWRAR